MDSFFYVGIILLALALIAAFFWGGRRNIRISAWIAAESEGAFAPHEKEYINIGGVIGYHFQYRLAFPFSEAKGTFTLLARHSFLYFPVSWLLVGYDRYYVHVYTESEVQGEGHILSEAGYRKACRHIEGIHEMKRKNIEKDGRLFILLWQCPKMAEKLSQLLNALPHRELLLHFCSYPDNQVFFIYLKPQRYCLRANLKAFLEHLPQFLISTSPHETT